MCCVQCAVAAAELHSEQVKSTRSIANSLQSTAGWHLGLGKQIGEVAYLRSVTEERIKSAWTAHRSANDQ